MPSVFIYNHIAVLKYDETFLRKGERLFGQLCHIIARFSQKILPQEPVKRNVDIKLMHKLVDEKQSGKKRKKEDHRQNWFQMSFWHNILYVLKILAPIAWVFQVVHSDEKLAIGYINKAMDHAKKEINKGVRWKWDKYLWI